MYYCNDCERRFSTPKKVVETHGFPTPPYEVYYICPFCDSSNYNKIEIAYCKGCGRRLNNPADVFCSDSCRITTAKLYAKEEIKKQTAAKQPLNVIMRELDEYNKQHNTRYSYGQYVALIRPKLMRKKNNG